jgi:hypothetical protein
MKIESSLGDKGLYITECLDQETLSELLEFLKPYGRRKFDQLHFFRYDFPVPQNDFGQRIQASVNAAILEYVNGSNKNPSDYILKKSYSMSEWKLGKSLAPHIDSIKYDHPDTHSPRSIINALLYLTDDYEDGEIVFPEIDVAIRPKAGSVVVFDSDLQHGVNAVKSGLRVTASSNLYSIHAEDIDEIKALGYRYLV